MYPSIIHLNRFPKPIQIYPIVKRKVLPLNVSICSGNWSLPINGTLPTGAHGQQAYHLVTASGTLSLGTILSKPISCCFNASIYSSSRRKWGGGGGGGGSGWGGVQSLFRLPKKCRGVPKTMSHTIVTLMCNTDLPSTHTRKKNLFSMRHTSSLINFEWSGNKNFWMLSVMNAD